MAVENNNIDIKNEEIPQNDTDLYTKIISDSIKKYGVDVLVEDRSIDLLTSIIYKKLQSVFSGRVTEKEDVDSSDSSGTFGTLASIFGIISSVVFIYILLKKNGNENENALKADEMEIKKVKNTYYAYPFEFKSADEIRLKLYSGREKLVEKTRNDMIRYLNQIKAYSKDKLDKLNAITKVNFALLGPPGTGKTLFVYYIVTQVDRYLKEEYMKTEMKDLYEKIKKESPEALTEFLDEKIESKTLLVEISPGIVNNRYHGQSEKNINALFSAAKELTEPKYNNKAIIMFFDEAEVFFGDRGQIDASNQTAANIRSELLNRIGVQPNDKYRPIFVFCATNRFETFDFAFKRRFGTQLRLSLPDEEERDRYTRFIFREYNFYDKEIKYIVQLTKGRAQSFLPKYSIDFFTEDPETGEQNGFNLRKFLDFLYQNRENRDML